MSTHIHKSNCVEWDGTNLQSLNDDIYRQPNCNYCKDVATWVGTCNICLNYFAVCDECNDAHHNCKTCNRDKKIEICLI